MREKIAILGSTGSIGSNTLEVVSKLKDEFEVVALSADSNVRLLAKQAKAFRPKIISLGDKSLALEAKSHVPKGIRVVFGQEGLEEIVSRPDIRTVLFAISGSSCAPVLIHAIKKKKRIALANKESLVSAGSIIMGLAKRNGVEIIPIDSEHSAIFQCLEGKRKFLNKIYLTGSGGPLLDMPKGRFDNLPRSFILRHPKWRMGKKISVDSATMMNKGLEVIEACHLFGIGQERVEVLIHPEAVIHSMVELVDKAVFAQLSVPDMRLPIQYALTYPRRLSSTLERLDLAAMGRLSFRKPDPGRFPCLRLAREAARAGGTAPAVLSVSDEEAVKAYLAGKIRLTDISHTIEKALSRHRNIKDPAIGDIISAEGWAREETRSICYR